MNCWPRRSPSFCPDEPRDEIVAASRRDGDDEPHRLGGIAALRRRADQRAAQSKRSGRARWSVSCTDHSSLIIVSVQLERLDDLAPTCRARPAGTPRTPRAWSCAARAPASRALRDSRAGALIATISRVQLPDDLAWASRRARPPNTTTAPPLPRTPSSVSVGTSGASGERLGLVTASADDPLRAHVRASAP